MLSANCMPFSCYKFTMPKTEAAQPVGSLNGNYARSIYLSAAEKLHELMSSRRLVESLGRLGIEWKFIPKRAPW